jgi:hypothetical protein
VHDILLLSLLALPVQTYKNLLWIEDVDSKEAIGPKFKVYHSFHLIY